MQALHNTISSQVSGIFCVFPLFSYRFAGVFRLAAFKFLELNSPGLKIVFNHS